MKMFFKSYFFRSSLLKGRLSYLSIVIICMSVFTCVACQSLDDVYGRLDKIETDIMDLQSAIRALQNAYDQGKIIKTVTPLPEQEPGGWMVLFSDGTYIRIVNGTNGTDGQNGQDGQNGIDGINGSDGKDGVTPFLKIDQEGYWTISYDNGHTFNRLLDDEGNPIKAVGVDGKDGADGHDGKDGVNGADGHDGKDGVNGSDGHDGKDGVDGADGHDGKDGAEGLSIRLVVNEDGYYVVQTYYLSDPDTVINEIITPYTADASRVISSMTQDDKTHVITMVLADGSTFTFNMYYVTPTSIAILNVNPIYLSNGTQASVEFRVNPSNALLTLNGDDCQIELDKVGEVQTRSSYVSIPSNYRLVRVEQVYDSSTDEMKVGQYRAIIEDTKKSASYDEMCALVLNVEDANGDNVQISSSAFEVKCIGYENLPNTGMPIAIINTPNSTPIKSKVEWMEGATMTIINPDMSIDYQGALSIKGRGNSTWGYPKKPYALKLDKKEKVLGMKKHKRWCLLANWMDRTLMRNAVAFEIARNTGLAWTPSGKYVEVILNGKHIGNYYLCEQIKIDENRVNITQSDISVTDGEGLSGGYIFELDKYYDEPFKFRPDRSNLPWMFKDPDDVNEAQFNWVVNYVNEMEETLYDDVKFSNREFVDYMNLESYVDWWFVNELTMNWEVNGPKSCYMYKDKNGKMSAGPVWDYDWTTFIPKGTSSFWSKKALYYPKLFEDPLFVEMVKERWAMFKSNFVTNIPAFIESTKTYLKESDSINIEMWPIGGEKPNGDEEMNFDDAVERLKSAYLSKLNWLDGKIQQM